MEKGGSSSTARGLVPLAQAPPGAGRSPPDLDSPAGFRGTAYGLEGQLGSACPTQRQLSRRVGPPPDSEPKPGAPDTQWEGGLEAAWSQASTVSPGHSQAPSMLCPAVWPSLSIPIKWLQREDGWQPERWGCISRRLVHRHKQGHHGVKKV